MALSVTYSHKSRSTKAVLYGCTEAIQKAWIPRLEKCKHVIHHPLSVLTLFCDIERDRLFNLVDPIVREFVRKLLVIKSQHPGPALNSTPSDSTASTQAAGLEVSPEDFMRLCIEVSDLKIGLATWKQQIENLILHGEELAPSMDLRAEGPEDPRERHHLDTGTRIQRRLMELKGEYDEKIRECTEVIERSGLVAQLVRASFLLSVLPFVLSMVEIKLSRLTKESRVERHANQPQHL